MTKPSKVVQEYYVNSLKVMIAEEESRRMLRHRDFKSVYSFIYDGSGGLAHMHTNDVMKKLHYYQESEKELKYRVMSLMKYLRIVMERGYITKRFRK